MKNEEQVIEVKKVLEQIEARNIPSLKGKTKKQINSCIKAINKAFEI